MDPGALERTVVDYLANGARDDAAALAVRTHGPFVLGYLRAIIRELDDADDAFSIWAEAVWTGIGGFRGESTLAAWCYGVAWHAAHRVFRDPHRRRRATLSSKAAAHIVQEIRTSTASHLGTTAQTELAALRQQLTPEEQTILVLRLDRDLPWRDVAQILSTDDTIVSEAAARKRYERVRIKVRDLAAAGGLLKRRSRDGDAS